MRRFSAPVPDPALLVAATVFLLDQATKLWAGVSLRARVVVLLPGILSFRPFENPGLFFGLWRPFFMRPLTMAVSLAVLLLTARLRRRGQPGAGGTAGALACGLIWGGVVGNQVDRLLFGAVFDFVALWRIPIFNLADVALTFGALIMAVLVLGREKTRC